MAINSSLHHILLEDNSGRLLESRPIEINPFFHYWPGSTALTFSTWPCNFDCVWCQNHHLPKSKPNPRNARYYPPKTMVEQVLQLKDKDLCAIFQKPTILTDYNIPLFELGRKEGLCCCLVSNGYMTIEALRLLHKSGKDGLKIDLKGDAETYNKYCGGVDVEKVWRNIREAKRLGLHLEVVNLVVTSVNDDEECLTWIIERHLKEAGADIPLHFTRYYPAYRFHNPATKIESLEKAYNMARKAGVLYPYIGNVRSHKYENTYCPNCEIMLIQRGGYTILNYKISCDKRCPKCGQPIPITGEYVPKLARNFFTV